ncbi:PKD domain-containing protein [bacterium]|nr:PKD domain-containing protein [bacterium]
MKKITYLMAFFFTVAFSSLQAQNCHADFQYWSNGLTAQFMDSSFSTSGNHSHSWDFGDGQSAFTQSPAHTYSQAGTYTVCLMIADTLCGDTICKPVTVSNPNPPCTASFNSSVDWATNAVTFTNTTPPTSPLTYTWDFGDGSPYSTVTSPTHTYATTGVYVVTLYAAGAGVACQYTDTINVHYCNSSFTSQVSGNTVTLTNTSYASVWSSAYYWDFGDGNSSTAVNPTHTYASSGVYTITLTTDDSLINCLSTYSDSVVIGTTPPPASCNASYTIMKDTTAQYSVYLINTSSNLSSHIYTWDFGDGNFGSGRTPSHQYASFGDYVVCLQITDTLMNCISYFCDTVGMDSLGNLKSAAGFSITVIDPTLVGIEKNTSLEEVTVYPNPAVSNLSVDLRAISSKVEIRIMDISGRVIMERNNNASGNIEQFDISNLENGLYIISLNDGKSQKTQKFIKTK